MTDGTCRPHPTHEAPWQFGQVAFIHMFAVFFFEPASVIGFPLDGESVNLLFSRFQFLILERATLFEQEISFLKNSN
jgi:hypothetical protein